jgi:hypothetical protein
MGVIRTFLNLPIMYILVSLCLFQSLSLSLSLSYVSGIFIAIFREINSESGIDFICLGNLIKSDRNRSKPNCVASPYVGKASKGIVLIAAILQKKIW